MGTWRRASWGLPLGLLGLAMLSPPARADGGVVVTRGVEPSGQDAEALTLGRKVLAVHAALRDPTAPDALRTLVDLGTDSRYYVMVRGWLSQQLQGDLSILEASGTAARGVVTDRVELLKKAIRAIDLE